MATVHDILVQRLGDLERQGCGTLAPPAAILWTDRHNEWAAQVAVLRTRCTVLTLGEYSADERTGPAIWLRCMLGRTVEQDRLLPGVVPIVYLPGVGREDIRAVEDCAESLRPLAELQYRSVFFSHPNGKDWTVNAWLSHKQRGAGIEIAGDQETHDALVNAQTVFFEQDVEALRGRVLRASDLNELLNPDETADLLRWLDDERAFRDAKTPEAWRAFASQVKGKYGFDVEAEGILAAAEELAERRGEWAHAWRRFAEAPHKYPNLPDVLSRVTPSELIPAHPDSYPSLNADAEDDLRRDLLGMRALMPADARKRVVELEEQHGVRRASVWSQLGDTQLADALEYLANLADRTDSALAGASVQELAAAYAADGWRADDAYLRALESVESGPDTEAVQACASAVYGPWVEASARALQQAAGGEWPSLQPLTVQDGTCVVFCDGLRYDLAERLASKLEGLGHEVELSHRFASIPTLTASGKPAVTPVLGALVGGSEFTPSLKESGQEATAPVLRKLMEASGWQVLDSSEVGDVSGRAWTEIGDIDAMGHKVGIKLVTALESELRLVSERIGELLGAGWQKVMLVTDHGWLLMPDKLNKVDLPKNLAEPRAGRCARLKPESQVDGVIVPWSWDADVRIALAPGASTFVDGKTFEHGGMSPQECVTPVLTCATAAASAVQQVELTQMQWRGLRLRVMLAGAHAGCSADLRRKAGSANSSYVGGARLVNEEGSVALLVSDDDLLGESATLVIVDSDGGLLLQRATIIGGDE